LARFWLGESGEERTKFAKSRTRRGKLIDFIETMGRDRHTAAPQAGLEPYNPLVNSGANFNIINNFAVQVTTLESVEIGYGGREF
jgi:hypothetical protein